MSEALSWAATREDTQDPIKVLFDISVLGQGHRDNAFRTGLFRVIENLAYQLAQRPDVELAFSATLAWYVAHHAQDYLRRHLELNRVPLDAPQLRQPLIGSLEARMRELYANVEVPLRTRILRRSLRVMVLTLLRGYSAWRTRRLSEYDVVHSPFYALPPRSRTRIRPAYFLTVHDLIPVLHAAYEGSHFQHWFGGMLKSLRPNDHVLSVSHATKNELCNYFPIDPAKVFVVHNAASPDMFYRVGDVDEISRVRRSFGIPDGAHYVLSLNSLEPRKNLGHAVRSFARLVEQERVRDLYLVLAGPRGEHSQALAAAIAGSMIARERVIFTGYVPDGDLAALYSGALFFVFPSLYEGFGLPVLEAMQCGVPVVTSNTSSLPEVAGDAGVLVDPSDADALPQAMLELYRDAERRRELTARGLARARTFSWERCAAQTVAAYRTALGS